jgi:hypothetical protein
MNSRSSTEPVTGRIGVPRARFSTVLVLLLGLLFWVVGPGAGHDSRILFELTVGAVLLAAIVTATDDRRRRRTVILLGCLAVLLNVIGVSGYLPARLAIGPGTAALFAAYATVRALGTVLKSRRVTGDVLAGALAAYVMAGLTFAIIYGVIEAGTPGAFHLAEGTSAFPDVVYFSFVTLLTVGFGDVTPALPLARAVALFEGLFGVVYSTMVMAALVAAYLEGRRA